MTEQEIKEELCYYDHRELLNGFAEWLKNDDDHNLINKYTVDAYLESIGKNEAICNCENEYWKEDEGGDWYCTIHDKQA